MNKSIVERIKSVRKNRGLTQQDLADKLGKTAAAISELERGKVQITASDLYELSILLNKPIEYFYGELFVGDEIQDLIAIFRKMPDDIRETQIAAINSLLTLQTKVDAIRVIDPKHLGENEDLVKEVYESLINYLLVVTEMRDKGLAVKEQLEEGLGISS